MKDQIKMIIFVILLGIAASAILLGTESFTSDILAENLELSLKSTVLDAFEIEYGEEEIREVYEESIIEETIDSTLFYTTSEGYVGFEIAGSGLWGPIEGFLALEKDLETIKSIKINYNEETPGLGGIVAEKWYLDKYRGKKFNPEILVIKNADPSSDHEVDAITGATNTSDAFELLLNNNYQAGKELLQ